MSSRENLEITNPNSLFHLHKSSSSMMPAIQRSKRKLRKRRVIISIILLLPALAAIIGIVAWAISVEVAKSNEINSSPATIYHRKLQMQKQQQQQSNSYQQLFKRNRAAEQPVAAAVISPLTSGKNNPTDFVEQPANIKNGEKQKQQKQEQHVTSTSRKRVLATEEQVAAAQDKKGESGQKSSTLLLTNIEQAGVLTSGLTSSSSSKENDNNDNPELDETTTTTTTASSFSDSDHHQHELSSTSLNSRNDPIKQHGPKQFISKQKASSPSFNKEETQGDEEEDKQKQRNSNRSKLRADMKKPINFNSQFPSSITDESERDENDQQASKIDSSAPWKQDYLMKQDSALAKKQRFIKLDDVKTGASAGLAHHQAHRVEGAQYTIIINNNKQPTANTNAREATSINEYETTTEQSPAANNNNNNNNNANNGNNNESLPVGMSDEQSTGLGAHDANLEGKLLDTTDHQKEREQDELSFEAIASAISTSLNEDSQQHSGLPHEPLEGDTGTLDQADEGKGSEQVGAIESRSSSIRRRTTGQNVAEVIDHIVEHRKAQQGLAPNLKGPQIVVVAPVVGSMMKASRSLTRVLNADESKAAVKKPEVSEDKRISSSMKKDAIILAQERKLTKQQQQQVVPSSSIGKRGLPRTKPLGARLLGISMPPGDKGDSLSSSLVDKNDGEGIKFSERVQVIEDDDSSSMLALNLQDNNNNDNNNDKDKNKKSLAASVELITAPSEHQFKRSWATHEGDQELDELSAIGNGNSNVVSSEQLALEDRSSIHVASQAGQPRHRSPRHGTPSQFDLERYQHQQQAPSSSQHLQSQQLQSHPHSHFKQSQQQQPARLYSAEQLIREHMLKAMSKAAEPTNSSSSPVDGANSSISSAPEEPNGQVKMSPTTSVRPSLSNNRQSGKTNELSGSSSELTNEQLADDSSHPAERPTNGIANLAKPSSQRQANTFQTMESQQVNRYQSQQQQQQEQPAVGNQLPVFADQEYNVPAHMAESVIHNLEQSPVSMYDSQQQQQLAKGQVPLLRYYHQQQFNSFPPQLQRQIINHQQNLQAASSQQRPYFLPITRWHQQQQQQMSFRQPAHLQSMVANQQWAQLGRSSSGATDMSASSSEQVAKTTRSNPTMALRQLFSSMRHRSGAMAAAAASAVAPTSSSSSSSALAVPAPALSSYSPSLSTRSGKEDLVSSLSSPLVQQQQAKLSSGPTSPVQDQEAQDSYGQMPVYHMMGGGPAEQHYAPQPHYQTDYNDNDKKSKGITFHFGGGPIGGGTQLITSPMGIFKHLMIPLLPNPRVNLNGKVVFGVVLEKSTAFGEPKKKYKFWG